MSNRPNVGEVWSVENRGHHHLVYVLKVFDRLLRVAFVCDNPPAEEFLTKKDIHINDDAYVVKTWHCISIPTKWLNKRILVVPKRLRNKIFEAGINEILPADKIAFRREELFRADSLSIAALFAVMDEMEMEMEKS